MKADIVNRISFEFEVEEGLAIYSALPSRTDDETFIGKFKNELEAWLENNAAFDE